MIAVCLAILALSVFFSLLSYLFFWYEHACHPHRARLTALSRGHVGRLILRGVAGSILSQLIVVLTDILGFLPPMRNLDLQGDGPPVLMVHGLYHNASAWIVFGLRLKRHGFGNLHARNFRTISWSAAQNVERLRDAVKDVFERNGGRKVILIGHSLGGLLVRAALRDPETASMTASAVTLGTPHHGSRLAVLGPGRCARDLRCSCPFLRWIETTPQSGEVPGLSLYSPLDNMVLPADNLRLTEPGWTEAETSPVNHLALIYHGPSARLVIEFMRRHASERAGVSSSIA